MGHFSRCFSWSCRFLECSTLEHRSKVKNSMQQLWMSAFVETYFFWMASCLCDEHTHREIGLVQTQAFMDAIPWYSLVLQMCGDDWHFSQTLQQQRNTWGPRDSRGQRSCRWNAFCLQTHIFRVQNCILLDHHVSCCLTKKLGEETHGNGSG